MLMLISAWVLKALEDVQVQHWQRDENDFKLPAFESRPDRVMIS